MTIQQKSLITLVKSAISKKSYDLPEGFDLSEIFKTARKHGITSMVYYGARICGIDKNCDIMRESFKNVCTSIIAGEHQDSQVKSVMDAFVKNEIEFMALKGIHLKKLYPRHELRKMGDADILIKQSQYERIRGVMTQLGFTEKLESDHELIWIKAPVVIELHKRLIPSYNKDYYAYFGDGWKLAKVKSENGFEYNMTAEDNMVYLFTHFAKHYRDCGIGIRHLVDLWVYKYNNPSLDEEYINKELEKLQLDVFYSNIIKTLGVWFEDAECDDVSDFITQVIFSSGVYGKAENRTKSIAIKERKKGKNVITFMAIKIFKTVFKGYGKMAKIYPCLNKFPILLPIMWIVHLFERIFNKHKRNYYIKTQLLTSKKAVDEYAKSLAYVGLDFNFS